MLKNWSNYTLQMRQIRQKYLKVLHRATALERRRILQSVRRRVFKGGLLGALGLGCYYYGNQAYSERVEAKKMRRVLMRLYPGQTYLVSFVADPNEDISEVEISGTEELEGTKTPNKHCIYLK